MVPSDTNPIWKNLLAPVKVYVPVDLKFVPKVMTLPPVVSVAKLSWQTCPAVGTVAALMVAAVALVQAILRVLALAVVNANEMAVANVSVPYDPLNGVLAAMDSPLTVMLDASWEVPISPETICTYGRPS